MLKEQQNVPPGAGLACAGRTSAEQRPSYRNADCGFGRVGGVNERMNWFAFHLF